MLIYIVNTYIYKILEKSIYNVFMKYRIRFDKDKRTMTMTIIFDSGVAMWQRELKLSVDDDVSLCLSNLFGKEIELCEKKNT